MSHKPTERPRTEPSLANLAEAERSARVIQFPAGGRPQVAQAAAGPPIYTQADLDAATAETARRVTDSIINALEAGLGPALPRRALMAAAEQRDCDAGA